MSEKTIKLHLGCQGKYVEGYVNIDLPSESHPVEKEKVDVYADVRELIYADESVDEVRSHHLLEHFSRQEALLLLARWHRWLKMGGMVHIETPDFEESAKKFLHSSIKEQFVFGRHIYGSHEAAWAYHKDFWCESKYRYVLTKLGFGEFRFDKISNNLEAKIPVLRGAMTKKSENLLKPLSPLGFNRLSNIVCYAKKVKNIGDYPSIIREILSLSLVGRETKILDVWMKDIQGKI